MGDIHLSFSDIQSFLRCRRAWDISSATRKGLKHVETPSLALSIGSAVHAGIQALNESGDPLEAVTRYMAEERAHKVQRYKDAHGFEPIAQEMREFDEAAELSHGMVAQYVKHYGPQPLQVDNLEHVASEVSFKILLPEKGPAGDDIYFVGTWDDLAVDIHTGTVSLVERKTYGAGAPHSRDLQHNTQMLSYAWAYQVVVGEPLNGVLYDGIAKKLIREPAILKDGSVSVAKNARVTLQGFLSAVQGQGHTFLHPKFGKKYAEYAKYLEDLESRDDNRFFYRELITFSQEQLALFGQDLGNIVHEMAGKPVIYPTHTRDGCRDCFFKDICYTMEKGYSVESLIAAKYKVKSYGTMQAIERLQPSEIDGVESLFEAVRNMNGTRI